MVTVKNDYLLVTVFQKALKGEPALCAPVSNGSRWSIHHHCGVGMTPRFPSMFTYSDHSRVDTALIDSHRLMLSHGSASVDALIARVPRYGVLL